MKGTTVDEKLRKKLLKEEFALRKKQPPAWAKAKYRRFVRLPKDLMQKKKDNE